MPKNHLKSLMLLGLLLSEAAVLSLSFDVKPLEHIQGFWFAVLSSAGITLKFLSATLVALLIGLGPRLTRYADSITQHHNKVSWPILIAHLACYSGLLGFSYIFLSTELATDASQLLPAGWLLLATVTITLWLFSFAPLNFWQTFVTQERLTLFLTLALGAIAIAIALTANELWTPLADATFAVCAWLLSLAYADVIVEPATYLLGTPEFLVRVGAACSGYEGIGLVLAFTTFYLSAFRAEFQFPHALILIPIGILTIWVSNTVRITLLIILGHEVSPDLAVNAFHSLAGWIFFVFISTALLLLSHRWLWVRKGDVISRSELVNPTTALLLPLIVLLTFTLLTGAFSGDFVWSYPLRVLAVGFALYYLRTYFDLKPAGSALGFPLAVGFAVFITWLLLVQPDTEADSIFSTTLAEAPFALAALWLLFRILGSVVTVPLAEELAFRGYLLSKLSGHDPTGKSRLPFSWFGIVASSAVFGVLHDAWIAGIVAGLFYAWARFHRDRLWDAIIAHGTTNLLLFLYAATTGHWSVW